MYTVLKGPLHNVEHPRIILPTYLSPPLRPPCHVWIHAAAILFVNLYVHRIWPSGSLELCQGYHLTRRFPPFFSSPLPFSPPRSTLELASWQIYDPTISRSFFFLFSFYRPPACPLPLFNAFLSVSFLLEQFCAKRCDFDFRVSTREIAFVSIGGGWKDCLWTN